MTFSTIQKNIYSTIFRQGPLIRLKIFYKKLYMIIEVNFLGLKIYTLPIKKQFIKMKNPAAASCGVFFGFLDKDMKTLPKENVQYPFLKSLGEYSNIRTVRLKGPIDMNTIPEIQAFREKLRAQPEFRSKHLAKEKMLNLTDGQQVCQIAAW